jgi:CRISPR/Cas system type I-B associated protein Csh2 (Cas7 group RAMP superfamily)
VKTTTARESDRVTRELRNELKIRKTAGRVRGPIQITIGESLDPIYIDTMNITRCCVTNEKDAKKERTGGVKYRIPYALYCFHIYFTPFDAKKSGFSEADLDCFENALIGFVPGDRSSMRGELTVRGVYRFSHKSPYGNAHADQLFERIQVKSKVKIPQSFSDYDVIIDHSNMPEGVLLDQLKFEKEPRNSTNPVEGRIEYVLLLDVKNGNPNGDPDADGRPRQDPVSQKGLITDVCLKRKIRNYIASHYNGVSGYEIAITEGNLLNDLIASPYETDEGVKKAFEDKKKKNKKANPEFMAQKVLCQKYFDIRTFGAVLSTGDASNEDKKEQQDPEV